MGTEEVIQALSNALVMIVMASIILAVGLGVLSGLTWVYIKAGKIILTQIQKAYTMPLEVFSKEPVKVSNSKRIPQMKTA